MSAPVESFMVSITFDDGRRTALTEGARILENMGLRGTFYPVTSLIGTENSHGQYGSWKDIERVARAGHEIGNHSHTHARELKEWPSFAQQEDIHAATAQFRRHGIGATTFAYPFGYYSETLRETVKNMGFSAARTIEAGVNFNDTDPFLLYSFMVEDSHGISEIEEQLRYAALKHAWLILVFHHIDNKTYISTPPDVFERMMEKVLASGAIVRTVSDGVQEMLKV